jgi:hypothetical protein
LRIAVVESRQAVQELDAWQTCQPGLLISAILGSLKVGRKIKQELDLCGREVKRLDKIPIAQIESRFVFSSIVLLARA